MVVVNLLSSFLLTTKRLISLPSIISVKVLCQCFRFLDSTSASSNPPKQGKLYSILKILPLFCYFPPQAILINLTVTDGEKGFWWTKMRGGFVHICCGRTPPPSSEL
jgi:hypothetical protein